MFDKQVASLKKWPELYGHSQRVASIAAEAARHEGLSKKEVEMVKKAGLLHDLGKLPERKLFEKASFTEEDKILAKNHVRTSFKMVNVHSPEIAKIIIAHHEFQDQGYPRSAYRAPADAKLCRMQKILAVADEADALLSKRSYKPAWSIKDTKKHLMKIFKDKKLVDFTINEWSLLPAQ